MTLEEIKLLRKIPLEELRHYLSIKDKKSYYIKNQMYEEAAELRDKERSFMSDFYNRVEEIDPRFFRWPISDSILKMVTIENLRELSIDEIIN